MKTKAIKALSLLLVMMTLVSGAEPVLENLAGFTHPEIGEFIVFLRERGAPYFTIYDFVQYKLMPSSLPYRGIDLSNSKKLPDVEASMNSFFDSVEGKSAEPVPVVFEYQGVLADYYYYLDSLPRESKIRAIQLMSGFDGRKGYAELKKIPGLEDLDTSYLEETYEDYTVRISGKEYPYRILMFYMEEDDWQESYYERYAYIKVGKQWKLVQIAKEYASEYRQRNSYIHGLAGQRRSDYDQIVHDAFRGLTWYSSADEAAAAENVATDGKTISVDSASVFRLPAQLKYTYGKKGWLSSIEYTFEKSQSFYSVFVSLYMRYYDPTETLTDGYSWSLPDTLIELRQADGAVVLTFTPRFDQSKQSAG